jgi:DNA-binding NarL/FixJ family response regulator
VLNLTFSRDNRVIESALRAGVDGYLLKSDSRTRSNLMRKLGLRSATAVTAYAIAHGYLRV